MRFFKYLVFSICLTSQFSHADKRFFDPVTSSKNCLSQSAACASFSNYQMQNEWKNVSTSYPTDSSCKFNFDLKDGRTGFTNTISLLVDTSCTSDCPTGKEESFKWWAGISLPSQVCLNKCVYIRPVDKGVGCVQVDSEGGKEGIEECGDFVSTGAKCDQPDPDPDTQPKPPLRPDECKNSTGSDSYCDKPPDRGCPSGYKQAMFNNKQICVKDSPTDPNPNDPNNGPDDPDPTDPPDPNNPPNSNGCTNGDPYCDKPPDNSCPTGYYQARYQGKDICVKNNPNNNGPNPNDPNNPPPDGNGDGDNGGGDGGAFCEEAGKLICDAVTDIKDSLNEIFSDDGKEEIEALGEPTNDPRFIAAETEATSALQSLANKLSYSSSHACVSDFTVSNIPHFGSMTVPLSKWCDLLALVKLLLKLAVLMLALKMIDATVRAF